MRGPERPRIVRAENDLLFDAAGKSYVDLFSGHGATWLGHAHPGIAAAVARQLECVWIAPGFALPAVQEATALVEGFFPASHELASFFSTGMEAAEFALRQARIHTGRAQVLGFERGMHGKSLATASLGWENPSGVRLPDVSRLPFLASHSEAEILEQARNALGTGRVAALFAEPIQGCGGGRIASPSFYDGLAGLCAKHGTLLVFDEILSGFHRTGPPFVFSELGFVPDVVLVGKALGNGFPVSGVVSDRRIGVRPEMLPGSTFAGNPLAAAAVGATLEALRALDLETRVAEIGRTLDRALSPLRDAGVEVCGRGALWVLTVPERIDLLGVVLRVHERGVSIGHAGHEVRVLPAATIRGDRLEKACDVVVDELLRALEAPGESS